MKANLDKSNNYSDIISEIINACDFENFLELGIDTGYTTKKVLDKCYNIKNVYCVDIRDNNIIKYESQNKSKITYFFNTTTDNFFQSKHLDSIDCVFIDADHSYNQSRIDFMNSFDILVEDGLIFLHDTYPPNIKFTVPSRNGDTYKLYEELSTNEWNNKIDIINLPIYDGLTIIRKRSIKKIYTL